MSQDFKVIDILESFWEEGKLYLIVEQHIYFKVKKLLSSKNLNVA